jgi:prepilin-type N-terminal cleavage/methylation domain-containing protein
MNNHSAKSNRLAFTLVELLVVMAVVGAMIALLLPAIQAAREATRRTTCINNTRQVALATLAYVSAHSERLPAMWRSDRPAAWDNFSWRATILPYLEEQALHDNLDLDVSPIDPANRDAVSRPIANYQCPSAESTPRIIYELGIPGQMQNDLSMAAHDVVAIYNVLSIDGFPYRGVWHGGKELQIQVSFNDVQPDQHSAWLRTRIAKLRNVPDGFSKSALLVEQAGKPLGLGSSQDAPEHAPSEGAWATCDVGSFWGNGVNTHNYRDPFGFHRGAILAFCDGAVMLVTESMPKEIMVSLLSRDGNEIVSAADWQ